MYGRLKVNSQITQQEHKHIDQQLLDLFVVQSVWRIVSPSFKLRQTDTQWMLSLKDSAYKIAWINDSSSMGFHGHSYRSVGCRNPNIFFFFRKNISVKSFKVCGVSSLKDMIKSLASWNMDWLVIVRSDKWLFFYGFLRPFL